jgi:hypothetical protein
MIQIPLLVDDPVHRLMLFGYSEREAEFLCLAGLQSGFFLRRQFTQFAGRRAGGADAALIEKVLRNRHACAVEGCRQIAVYHLCARPFYAALASGDNRNRRMRPPDAIKGRLMALDYVLDHPGPRYLGTEHEKVDYFTRSPGIDLAALPVKNFRSPDARSTTARYFVDKYPIALREHDDGAIMVCFAFIDEGFATCARFDNYLRQYNGLFGHLPRFELRYVAAFPNLFWEAERLFQRFASGERATGPTHLSAIDVNRLLGHFEDRKRVEAGDWQGLSRDKLIQLRKDQEMFSEPVFTSLYDQWKVVGPEAVRYCFAQMPRLKPWNGVFKTHLLKHRYDLFGTGLGGANA